MESSNRMGSQTRNQHLLSSQKPANTLKQAIRPIRWRTSRTRASRWEAIALSKRRAARVEMEVSVRRQMPMKICFIASRFRRTRRSSRSKCTSRSWTAYKGHNRRCTTRQRHIRRSTWRLVCLGPSCSWTWQRIQCNRSRRYTACKVTLTSTRRVEHQTKSNSSQRPNWRRKT